MSETQTWQPIATAPKDGTEVLLAEFHHGAYGTIEHGQWGFIETSEWDGSKCYGWQSDTGRIEEPTHWMAALPKPAPDEVTA
jgi:hypothetical protein